MLSRVHRLSLLTFVLLLAALAAVAPLSAQERAANAPPAPTADDYARAEKFLAPALSPLVVGGSATATWLPDDRFTYRSTTTDGVQFLLVDPVKATKVTAFPAPAPRPPPPPLPPAAPPRPPRAWPASLHAVPATSHDQRRASTSNETVFPSGESSIDGNGSRFGSKVPPAADASAAASFT